MKIKNDLVKARKLAEGEVVGLHDDLDNAEKTIGALNGNLSKQQKAIQELQMALEDANKGAGGYIAPPQSYYPLLLSVLEVFV